MYVTFHRGPKWPKFEFVEKNRLKSLQLSKFTPSTAQQSAAHSDDRLKSYGQKPPVFGRFAWGRGL